VRPAAPGQALRTYLREVLSTQAVRAFKPAPRTYRWGCETVDSPPERTALLAAHSWDVHGAIRAGLVGALATRLEGWVPDVVDRYWTMQFVDAWTNNFAYVGRRATGTGEGDFLLTSSEPGGPVPDGMRRIAFPSAVAAIVGRLQLDGAADLPAVHALQDAFTLRPLEAGSDAAPAGMPAPEPSS
jgi:hypothetical protein